MKLEVDTAKIWMALAGFCYRRACGVNKQEPDGIPGRRSPEAFCDGYEPRKKRLGDQDDCMTDGHYLCYKCCHRSETKPLDDDICTCGHNVQEHEAVMDCKCYVFGCNCEGFSPSQGEGMIIGSYSEEMK